MLEHMTRQPDDPLLALSALFRADPKPEKIDLGVGVYRDAEGRTPVFEAVKRAERRLLSEQQTKAYLGPEGDTGFIEALWSLIGGEHRLAAGVQSVGGTGALRLAAELLKRSGTRRILLGLPSWPNHAAIFEAAGLQVLTYPFFETASQRIVEDEMLDGLAKAQPGDAVLLHGCCHNPTGAVAGNELWQAITDRIVHTGLIPLVDLAYQGFGAGIQDDVAPLRRLLDAVPEVIIAASCSKSFGLYRERTGAVYVTAPTASDRETARSHLVQIGRASYSMPPDHGAAVVRTILTDPGLRHLWQDELEAARLRICSIRAVLADGLAICSNALGAIAGQQGMFSLLPIGEAEVLRLRRECGIYMPLSGRINIAGLNLAQAARVIPHLVGVA